MIRLSLKICLIVALTFAIYTVVLRVFPMAVLDRGYPIYKAQKEAMAEPQGESIIFLGDSRAVSSIAPLAIPDSRSLSIIGTTPVDAYYMMKKHLAVNSVVRTVFITFAWDNLGTKHMPETIANRGGFYNFYTVSDFREVKRTANRLDRRFSEQIAWMDFCLARIKAPQLVGQYIRTSRFGNRRENMGIYDKFTKQKGHITSIWGEGRECDGCVANETMYDAFEIKPVSREYLEKLAGLCSAAGVTLIFETIPFNASSMPEFRNDVPEQYAAYVNEFQAAYPEHVFSDTLFSLPDSLFEDPHHMNPDGAAVYSKYLLEKYFSGS